MAAYPGQSGADIARLALLTPQTVSVIVANLEKGNLINRLPHKVHGRIQTLELTKSGRALLAAARERMHGLERELTDGMSPKQERIVRRLVAMALAGMRGAPATRNDATGDRTGSKP